MRTLEERMKRYEEAYSSKLTIRTPIIIRVDGWHFKSFTKGFEKPFDKTFRQCMYNTMLSLCTEIPDVVFAYTQSDEISLLILNYQSFEHEPWFDNRFNKLISLSSALATREFNHYLSLGTSLIEKEKVGHAAFDARVFTIPEDDIVNYFYWRQKDAIRNSIENVAQTYFNQKDLNGLSQDDLLKKLKDEKCIIWSEYPTMYQRGICAYRNDKAYLMVDRYLLETGMPVLANSGRNWLQEKINGYLKREA